MVAQRNAQGPGRAVVAMLVVATVYFLFVLALGINLLAVPALQRTVSLADFVLAGSVLFMLIIVAFLVLLVRGRGASAAQAAISGAPTAVPTVVRRRGDDEYVVTNDEFQGMRVLEYSHPPKSKNQGAIYAKALVPVTREYVLRVEEIIAQER
ncbi:MAG TPA: hypothetical protein VM681_08945 [Candidatus Thermoplasmatota archaeon]|nr:hypothetical protein [Candidatus Thermoplasmatota archaeon]